MTTLKTQIRGLDNLNVTPEANKPLLIPVLQSKLPGELGLIISDHLNDLDC